MHMWLLSRANSLGLTGSWVNWLVVAMACGGAWSFTKLVRDYYGYQGKFFDFIGLFREAHTVRIKFGVLMIAFLWVYIAVISFLSVYAGFLG